MSQGRVGAPTLEAFLEEGASARQAVSSRLDHCGDYIHRAPVPLEAVGVWRTGNKQVNTHETVSKSCWEGGARNRAGERDQGGPLGGDGIGAQRAVMELRKPVCRESDWGQEGRSRGPRGGSGDVQGAGQSGWVGEDHHILEKYSSLLNS